MNLNIKTNIDMRKALVFLTHVWQKTHVALFFIVLITAIFIGGYIWKQNVYSSGWSNEKKQEYLKTQNQEVVFREEDFQKVLGDITLRKDKISKTYQSIKDIFKSYK